jgi:hypothetical protein
LCGNVPADVINVYQPPGTDFYITFKSPRMRGRFIFPPKNVGGEFVRKVLVAGLLSKLDTGAPHNRRIFRGGLWFNSEEEAEKIPVGFNSEKCFTKVNKDGNVANGVRVEVMEFKPVIVKKATKKGARGEGQTPFGKMVKCDDFVNIFHGERFAE